VNEETSFQWQSRIATKGCNLFTSKKSVLEIFKGFHPILDDRNIIKIVLVFIFLTTTTSSGSSSSSSSSSSKFLCFHFTIQIFARQDKIWMQLEEIILVGKFRFVIFSALHTNKAAQILCKHTSSIM